MVKDHTEGNCGLNKDLLQLLIITKEIFIITSKDFSLSIVFICFLREHGVL